MALKFIDGFDHYNSPTLKWDSASGIEAPSWVAGRFGGYAISFNGPNARGVTSDFSVYNGGTAYSEVFTGFGFKMTDSIVNDGVKAAFYDSAGTEIARLYLNNSNNLELRRGTSTVLATGATNISADVWYYIELRYKPLNSGGEFECRLNGSGSAEVTYTGDVTAGLEDIEAFQLGDTGANGAGEDLFDDFYFLDTSGSTNNTWLGDVRVVTTLPTADTSAADFTPSAGVDNHLMVDEQFVDSDTTYVENGSIAATDRYTMGTLGVTGTIFGVQTNTAARKTDTSTRAFKASMKSGTTTKEDLTEHTLATSYQIYPDMYEVNPDTSTTWTESEVNAVEAGFRVTI